MLRLSALRLRQMATGDRTSIAKGRAVYNPLCRRFHHRVRTRGGCEKGESDTPQTHGEIWIDDTPREKQTNQFYTRKEYETTNL